MSAKRNGLAAGLAMVCLSASAASAAQRLVETVAGTNVDVGETPVNVPVAFTTNEPVSGVGLTCLWTGVVKDNEDGIAPWSLDLQVTATAPNGVDSVYWAPVGGDVTIADFPLQDFTPGLPGVNGNGTFNMLLSSAVPAPWVMGLRNVQWHVLTEVPDVVTEWNGTTLTGDGQWNRPYYLYGISSLGPVNYRVIEFEVSVSGGYEFTSVVSGGNNFTFLYEGTFDANQPLNNLFEYGLGNGNAPNGSPQGTSFISVLLHAGTRYSLVNSQWDRFSPGTPYTNTVVGPGGLINVVPPLPCTGDLDGNFTTDVLDFSILAANFGTSVPAGTGGDLDFDADVDVLDFAIFAANFGCGGPS